MRMQLGFGYYTCVHDLWLSKSHLIYSNTSFFVRLVKSPSDRSLDHITEGQLVHFWFTTLPGTEMACSFVN